MLENKWARDYLKGVLESNGNTLEDLQGLVADVNLADMDDPLLEIEALRQGGSAAKCFKMSIAGLAQCNENAPLALIAELIETVEESHAKALMFKQELPRLKKAAAKDPRNGEKLAKLGFAFSALDEWESALSAYTRALEYPDTLCFQCHRDCLVNIGWEHYLKAEYEESLGWFEMACRINEPKRGDGKHVEDSEGDEPETPYKLALENVLLALAKMGRLTEAAARLQEYHDWFGRLPQYESRALEKLGLQPDVIYIRSRTHPTPDDATDFKS
jgi:tetratricopeptide (TPR) repeat protein